MGKLPKLTKDKEHLVLKNLNMVHYILQKRLYIYPEHKNYEDYYQEGVIGLILSAIRYDESKGFQFSTFAFPNIVGSIKRYRRDNDSMVHSSRRIKDVLFKIARYTAQGYTIEEIEQITEISRQDIQDAINVSSVGSLNQTLGNHTAKQEGEGLTIEETVACSRNDYEDLLSEENIYKSIQVVSDQITNPVYRGIWEEYIYGTFYGEKFSQNYFSTKYGMSQPQVSRILRRYKNKFQEVLTK